MDTKNEEEVDKNGPGTIMDNDFGEFFVEDAYIHSEKSDINVLHSLKLMLLGNSEDPKTKVIHEPSQEDTFSCFSSELIEKVMSY